MKKRFFIPVALCLLLAACTNSVTTPDVEKPLPTQPPASPTGTPLPLKNEPTATSIPLSPAVVSLGPDAISPDNIGTVTLLNRMGGKGYIRTVSYSPDGKFFTVTTSRGIVLYDAETLAEISFVDGLSNDESMHYFQSATTPQGDFLMLGERFFEETCTLVLWRFSEAHWQPVGEVETGDWECLGQALSPDGKYLATVDYSRLLTTVWRTDDLTQVQAFPLEYPDGIYSIRVQLAFSGQDTLAVVEDSYIRVYDLQTGERRSHLEAPEHASLNRLAISLDGQVVAARSQSTSTILVWRLHQHDPILLPDAEEDWNTGRILLSPDGALVAFTHNGTSSSPLAGWVDIWQTRDGRVLPRLQLPSWGYGPSIAFAPDGAAIATGEGDGVQLWQVSDGALHYTFPGYASIAGPLSPAGTQLASSSERDIQIYDLVTGELLHTLAGVGQAQGFFPPVFSPDGHLLVSLRLPRKVQLWNAVEGVLERTLEYECVDGWSKAIFSPDGQYLAVYANSEACRGVKVWQVAGGKSLYEYKGGGGDSFSILPEGSLLVVEDAASESISFVQLPGGTVLQTIQRPPVDEYGGLRWAYSPVNQLYALGVTNGSVQVWQLGKSEPLFTLTSSFEWTDVYFSPDGKSLITSADAVKVWNASDGRLRYQIEGMLPYQGVPVSPDGRILVTLHAGGCKLWNLSDGALLHTLPGSPLFFSPDSQILVSHVEGTTLFWRVADGELLRSLEGTALPVAFSPDGELLIAVSDGVTETWGIP